MPTTKKAMRDEEGADPGDLVEELHQSPSVTAALGGGNQREEGQQAEESDEHPAEIQLRSWVSGFILTLKPRSLEVFARGADLEAGLCVLREEVWEYSKRRMRFFFDASGVRSGGSEKGGVWLRVTAIVDLLSVNSI